MSEEEGILDFLTKADRSEDKSVGGAKGGLLKPRDAAVEPTQSVSDRWLDSSVNKQPSVARGATSGLRGGK